MCDSPFTYLAQLPRYRRRAFCEAVPLFSAIAALPPASCSACATGTRSVSPRWRRCAGRTRGSPTTYATSWTRSARADATFTRSRRWVMPHTKIRCKSCKVLFSFHIGWPLFGVFYLLNFLQLRDSKVLLVMMFFLLSKLDCIHDDELALLLRLKKGTLCHTYYLYV